jgi:hypothetical protein
MYAGERLKQYAKGPDVMSKSKRTQEHYQKQNKDQTSLTGGSGFTSTKSGATVKDSFSQALGTDNLSATQSTPAPQIMTSVVPPQADVLPPSGSRAQSASVLSDLSTDAGNQEKDQKDPSGLANVQEDVGGESEEEQLDVTNNSFLLFFFDMLLPYAFYLTYLNMCLPHSKHTFASYLPHV